MIGETQGAGPTSAAQGENKQQNDGLNGDGKIRDSSLAHPPYALIQNQILMVEQGMNSHSIPYDPFVPCLEGDALENNQTLQRDGDVANRQGYVHGAELWPEHPIWQSFRPVRVEEDASRVLMHSEAGKVSKRRVRPTEPILLQQEKIIEDKLSGVDAHFTDCGTHSYPKGRKNGVRQQVSENCLWIYHQYFYSNHDRMYFCQEDEGMRRILTELNLDPQHTTYRDYQSIHNILPPPHLFSLHFIYEERNRLSDFRASARNHSRNKLKNDDFQLAVGREVFAVHPNCGHIHSGSILAQYKESIYMVKFNHADLGTKPISDTYIHTKEHSFTNGCIVDRLQHESMALAIQLLIYKSDLIQQMREYNAMALTLKDQDTPLSNQFLQEYGWIGSTIKILSLGMKHIIARFRIRGLDPKNTEKIGKNYGTMLIHPLVNIGKALTKPQDHKAASKINCIVASQRQKKAEDLIHQFNGMWSAEQHGMEQDKYREVSTLVQACIKILVTLEYEPNTLHENTFITNIVQTIDCKSPEHVNEIYDRIKAIVSREGR